MLVTRETDYAVRCILYLAQADDQIANVTEVSRKMHIPKTFLAKIFQRLAKAGLVVSNRGMNGGFRLAKKPSAMSLLDIAEAIQRAREGASREDLILVTGSLYVVGDARAILVARAGQAGELTGLKG